MLLQRHNKLPLLFIILSLIFFTWSTHIYAVRSHSYTNRLSSRLDMLIHNNTNNNINNITKYSQIQTREPLRKISYMKTHKTGSGTLQGILFRLSYYAQPPLNIFISPTHKLTYESLKNAREKSNNIPQYWDIILQHSPNELNCTTHAELRDFYKLFIPQGRLVTIIRDPFARELSALFYFYPTKIEKFIENDPNAETSNDEKIWNTISSMVHFNTRSFADDLRLTQSSPSELISQLNDMDILILEHLDESLVLRHFLWNWPLEAFLYLKNSKSCNSEKFNGNYVRCPPKDIPHSIVQTFKASLSIEQNIYDHALATHKNAIASIPSHLWLSTLANFKLMKQTLADICRDIVEINLEHERFFLLRGQGHPTISQISENPELYCSFFWLEEFPLERFMKKSLNYTIS